MRFKLSTLLAAVTLLAVIVGLGYQIVTLRQQVAELRNEIQSVKKWRVSPLRINISPSITRAQFRLLNNNSVVDPSIERGMKADEWEMRQRFKLETPSAPSRTTIELGMQPE